MAKKKRSLTFRLRLLAEGLAQLATILAAGALLLWFLWTHRQPPQKRQWQPVAAIWESVQRAAGR